MTFFVLSRKAGPADSVMLGSGAIELLLAVAATAFVSAVLGLLISSLASTSEQVMPLLVVSVMMQLVMCGGLIPISGRAVLAGAQKQVEKGDAASVVGGLAETVSALCDIQRMWDDLAKVAPDEILPDVESVRDTSAKQLDNAGQSVSDPAGALGSALVNALVNSGPIRWVDAYTRQNCTG